MSFFKKHVWPALAGFVVASIVMLIFEYTNSFLFPIPADVNWNDGEAVRKFTSSLPWTAYVLVVLGWMIGAFKGGCVASYLAGDTKYRSALALGVTLTIAGYFNVAMLGHPTAFIAIALPQFLIWTYLGHRYLLHVRAKKGVTDIS
jgi:hypothetical protein